VRSDAKLAERDMIRKWHHGKMFDDWLPLLKWVRARVKELESPPTIIGASLDDAVLNMDIPMILTLVGKSALNSARRSIVGEVVPTFVDSTDIVSVFNANHKRPVPEVATLRAASIMAALPGQFEIVYGEDHKPVDRIDHKDERRWTPTWAQG